MGDTCLPPPSSQSHAPPGLIFPRSLTFLCGGVQLYGPHSSPLSPAVRVLFKCRSDPPSLKALLQLLLFSLETRTIGCRLPESSQARCAFFPLQNAEPGSFLTRGFCTHSFNHYFVCTHHYWSDLVSVLELQPQTVIEQSGL